MSLGSARWQRHAGASPRSRASMAMLGVVGVLAPALVAACAAVAPPHTGGEGLTTTGPGGTPPASQLSDGDRRAVEEAAAAIERDTREIATRRAETAPDCARACTLADNVCTLAGRICAIAARYPPGDPVAARCQDGRARCRRAHDDIAARCPCAPAAPRDP